MRAPVDERDCDFYGALYEADPGDRAITRRIACGERVRECGGDEVERVLPSDDGVGHSPAEHTERGVRPQVERKAPSEFAHGDQTQDRPQTGVSQFVLRMKFCRFGDARRGQGSTPIVTS